MIEGLPVKRGGHNPVQLFCREIFLHVLRAHRLVAHLIDLDGERELPHAFAALLPEAPESRQVTKDMISFFMAQ